MILKTKTSSTNYQSISKGKTVVFLHGWGCDWQIWSQQIRELSKTYKLIIPDLPAFGKSKITDDKIWNSNDYAVWLNDFLADTIKKNEPVIIIGHSFGAKILSIYTEKYRNSNLKAIVLVDSAGLPPKLSSSQKLISTISKKTPDFIKNSISHKTKSKLLSLFKSSTDNLNSTLIQKKILEQIVHENISETLKKITTNTLLIWGANDKDTPLEKGQEMSNYIKKSNLIIFKESGHFPFTDSSQKFNNKILTFLKENF